MCVDQIRLFFGFQILASNPPYTGNIFVPPVNFCWVLCLERNLKQKYEALKKDRSRLHEKKKLYFSVREDLIKSGAQLVMRRKQLISELAFIYPIREVMPIPPLPDMLGITHSTSTIVRKVIPILHLTYT